MARAAALLLLAAAAVTEGDGEQGGKTEGTCAAGKSCASPTKGKKYPPPGSVKLSTSDIKATLKDMKKELGKQYAIISEKSLGLRSASDKDDLGGAAFAMVSNKDAKVLAGDSGLKEAKKRTKDLKEGDYVPTDFLIKLKGTLQMMLDFNAKKSTADAKKTTLILLEGVVASGEAYDKAQTFEKVSSAKGTKIHARIKLDGGTVDSLARWVLNQVGQLG